jgi:hypothetical protein
VAEHLEGEKVRVFKYRPKKRYRRTAGHRSALTRLEIKEIKIPSAAKPADASAEGRKPAARETAKKPAPAKKKEPATGEAKKPAARKPAAKKTTPKES